MQILRNIFELGRFSTLLYGFVRFPTVSYDFKEKKRKGITDDMKQLLQNQN